MAAIGIHLRRRGAATCLLLATIGAPSLGAQQPRLMAMNVVRPYTEDEPAVRPRRMSVPGNVEIPAALHDARPRVAVPCPHRSTTSGSHHRPPR